MFHTKQPAPASSSITQPDWAVIYEHTAMATSALMESVSELSLLARLYPEVGKDERYAALVRNTGRLAAAVQGIAAEVAYPRATGELAVTRA